jgi:small-conductance mechanosensitive channel
LVLQNLGLQFLSLSVKYIYKIMFFKKILIIIFLIVPFIGINTDAQINLPSTNRATPELNSQSDKIQSLKDRISELQEKIILANSENEELENLILEQKKNQEELSQIIKTDEKRILEIGKLNQETSEIKESIEKERQEILLRTKSNKQEILDLSTKITENESRILANKKTIESIENQILPIENDLEKELTVLQSQVVILGISVSRYLLLLIFFWFLQQLIKFIAFKLTKNEVIRSVVVLASTLLAIGASIFTILIAFVGNLPFLLTSFGVVSAAMVVALQEFISSFFAWFVIQLRGPYRLGDLIQIQTNVEIYTGVVKNIGVFRTEISEKVGGETFDKEQFTGKIVDFPNNMILKHPVKNFTLDNNILWHNLDIVITFESDFREAKEVIAKTLNDYFIMAVDHKDDYLDDIYNLKSLYQPKVYFSIDQNGPCFTIWFAAKTGKLREVVERISMQILTEFQIKGIDLAYKTNRVISTGEYDKPSKFYLPSEAQEIS